MNIDTRINNDFFSHPKTVRLQAALGEIAPMFVIKLWLYASKFFSDGVIRGLSPELLEKQIGWTASPGTKFIETLEIIGFVERNGDDIILHDWDEHNQYASTDNKRKDLNRFNSLGRYYPEVAKILKSYNILSITAAQYKEIKTAPDPVMAAIEIFNIQAKENSHCESMQSHMQSDMQIASESKMPQIPNTKPDPIKLNRERESHPQPVSGNSVYDDMPSGEFMQLRDFYDRNVKPEGTKAGWIEFKKLRKGSGIRGCGYYPGIFDLMTDLDKRMTDGFWDKGFEPTLEKYLRERTWEQPITSRRKDNPPKSLPKTFSQIEEEREHANRERLRGKLKAIAEGK